MNPVTRSWQQIERRLARYRACRNVNLMNHRGIVCFTFDDVWRSACTVGAATLERYGAKGTFYICGGMTGVDKYHTKADLLRLIDSGHELGSHGFAHQSYQMLSKAEMLADIRDNHLFFTELGYAAPKSFAFPYGHVSPSAKRIAAKEFASVRGIHPGVNHPSVDLALLKAFPLYQNRWTEPALVKLLEENAQLCGLLIFFAHSIGPSPGQYDCSVELLELAVRMSIASGNTITALSDALPKGPASCPERARTGDAFRAKTS
jgi:hypothetical protein